MLNKPKFMSPSINMYGNSVIDVNSNELPFSCIIDGNESIRDFRIIISRITDNEVVYDTGVVTLSTPFLPINNRNQNVIFSIDLKEHSNQGTHTYSFINSSDAYYWSIYLNSYYATATSEYDEAKEYYTYSSGTYSSYTYSSETWSNGDGKYYMDYVVRSAEEVFYANSIPSTTVSYSYEDDFSDPSSDFSDLQQRKVFFKSTYTQDEGVELKRYGWRLTDKTSGTVIMDTITQNQIYGLADDISCVCNGLVNQNAYLLELYIETQNGYFGVLQAIDFNVNYVVKDIEATFDIEALNDTSGIMINWGDLRTTEGFVIGRPVSYRDDFPVQNTSVIEIPANSKVVFSGTSSAKSLSLDEDSYVVLSFQFDKTVDTTLVEMSGIDELGNTLSRKLEYIASDNKLKYTIVKGSTRAVYEDENELSDMSGELCWYIVTLYPLIDGNAEYKIVESHAQDALFPADNLYPAGSLYPQFGIWDRLRS